MAKQAVDSVKLRNSAVRKSAPDNAAFPVDPLIGILVVVGIFFGTGIVTGIVIEIIVQLFHLSDSPYVQFAYTALVEGLTIFLLFWFMRSYKISLRSIGLLAPKPVHALAFLAGYATYFLLNAVALVLSTALFNINTDQRQDFGFNTVHGAPELIVTFISLVLLPPIVEEIVMRGFLFSSLKKSLPVIPSALIVSVLFAVAHLQLGNGVAPLWLAAIDTFVLSLVLCALRQLTGNLWAGIAVHMLKNTIAFSVLYIIPLLGWSIS